MPVEILKIIDYQIFVNGNIEYLIVNFKYMKRENHLLKTLIIILYLLSLFAI
jgi:hypothetical protein